MALNHELAPSVTTKRAIASTDLRVTAGLLALAFLVGGAGVSFPLLQLALGAASLATAGYFLWRPSPKPAGPLDRWAWLLLALTVVLPLLQLIPLPPSLWHLLPGREVPREVDAMLAQSIWRPWTLDVEATVRSWLVVVPASVVFVGCMRLRTQERIRLLWLIVGFAVANALLGIIQLATGGGSTPYPSTHRGFPVGFFVNRNHSAAIMLAALPIAAALARLPTRRQVGRSATLVAALSVLSGLTIVVIGTTSRTGLLLLPISLAVSLFILLGRGSRLKHGLPALLAIAALGAVLVTSRGFDRLMNRFAGEDPRFAYWSDVQWALQHYGVAGTGAGTFVPVFQSAESLDGIVPQVINHAHNDYLELLLTGGVPAALIFLGFLALLAVAIHRGVRADGRSELALVRFGTGAAAALILGYSLVDYPLRMPAIAAAFAVLCAVLLPTRGQAGSIARRELSTELATADGSTIWRSARRATGIAALVLVLIVMVQAAMSSRALLARHYDAASRIAPWSTRANEAQSTIDLAQNHPDQAWAHAKRAIRLSPISAPAVRNLALVRMLEQAKDSDKLMQVAAALGWRDPLTQLWAIGAAQRSGEPGKAVQRAEALFRQHSFVLPALQLLLQGSDQKQISALLARRLAQRPDWRPEVLAAAGQLSTDQLQQFGTVIALVSRSGARVTSDELKPVLQNLVSDQRAAEAQRLWAQLNPALIANGDFTEVKEADGVLLPVGWDIPAQSREMVTVTGHDPQLRNLGLRIGQSSWVTVASQETMLPAGNYSFSYQAREAGRSPVTLRWQFRCRSSSERQAIEARLTPGNQWRSFGGSFNVPPRDCPIQTLALKRIEATDQSETWVDNVRFTAGAVNSL